MKVVAIIPARLESTRLPNKVLKDICGKTMIRRVHEQVSKVSEINEIMVATDHESIKKEVESFGGIAVLTAEDHATGTDRIVEVAKTIDADIIVNVQADEPLINPADISACLKPLLNNSTLNMSTLVSQIHNETEMIDNDVVKIVFDKSKHILYMSRSKIPSLRGPGKVYMHIGMYCYKRKFLLKYAALEQTPLELAESAEIMRLVENGYKIKVVEIENKPMSVDTPNDLENVISFIKLNKGDLE